MPGASKMRTTFRDSVIAPSSSLLRFLKFQSETVSFTAHARAQPCLCRSEMSHRVGSRLRPTRVLAPSSSRTFTATRSPVDASHSDSESFRLCPSLHLSSPVSARRHFRPGSVPQRTTRRLASEQPWLRRLWQFGGNAKATQSGPSSGFMDDTLNSDSLPNLGRTVSAKATNELKLRCTEFDENGNVTLVNGEFKKSELIQKYGLLPRDLRKIDSSLLPHILIRPSAILINLLHLRALIKHNRVLVFDAYGSTDSYTQSVFMYDLSHKLQPAPTPPPTPGPSPAIRIAAASSASSAPLPYEFRALEAVLISVTSALEAEFEGVREPVVRVLRELEEDIDRDKLRHLLIFSKKLGTFEQKAQLVRDAIDELLDADDDLAAMYLSEKASSSEGKGRGEDDHTEVEMLLESYHKVCDEIVQASGNLVSNIRNTEEIVKAILDANRNSLMLLDLKFSIGTLGTGSGAFIAALYGMNLKTFLEESDFGFGGVTATSVLLAALVCFYGLTKLRRVQRVSMWGEAGVGGSGIGVDGGIGRGGRVSGSTSSSSSSTSRNWREITSPSGATVATSTAGILGNGAASASGGIPADAAGTEARVRRIREK